MKEKLLIALSHTVKGYLTEPNATRLIQKTLKTLEHYLHCTCSYVALQNKKTSYLDIAHSHGVSRTALNNFHKRIGSNTIGRIFFKDTFTVVKPSDIDDYEELKIECDYKMCIASHIGWEGRTFGFLACYFDQEIEIDLTIKNFFISMAGAISAALEKEELLRMISELKQFDAETGIYTHQFFIARLEKEIQTCRVNGRPLSLVVMDMDNYKGTINLHGNDIAQEVLRSAAEELKNRIRGCDILGSLGIDEFSLFMPDVDYKYAEKIIQEFNEKLKSITFTDRNVKTSFSCGITELHHNDDLDGLMHRAQLALYNARKTGEGTLSIVP